MSKRSRSSTRMTRSRESGDEPFESLTPFSFQGGTPRSYTRVRGKREMAVA
jgi:hypothetical protein